VTLHHLVDLSFFSPALGGRSFSNFLRCPTFHPSSSLRPSRCLGSLHERPPSCETTEFFLGDISVLFCWSSREMDCLFFVLSQGQTDCCLYSPLSLWLLSISTPTLFVKSDVPSGYAFPGLILADAPSRLEFSSYANPILPAACMLAPQTSSRHATRFRPVRFS